VSKKLGNDWGGVTWKRSPSASSTPLTHETRGKKREIVLGIKEKSPVPNPSGEKKAPMIRKARLLNRSRKGANTAVHTTGEPFRRNFRGKAVPLSGRVLPGGTDHVYKSPEEEQTPPSGKESEVVRVLDMAKDAGAAEPIQREVRGVLLIQWITKSDPGGGSSTRGWKSGGMEEKRKGPLLISTKNRMRGTVLTSGRGVNGKEKTENLNTLRPLTNGSPGSYSLPLEKIYSGLSSGLIFPGPLSLQRR